MTGNWHGRFVLAAPLMVLLLVALAGCSGKTHVDGTVTYDGQTVDGGAITFQPTGGGGGKPVSGEIKGGKYYLDADKGLTTGSYKVEVSWKQKGKEIPSNDPPNKQYQMNEVIPKKYNAETTLTAEIKTGSNTANFDLKK